MSEFGLCWYDPTDRFRMSGDFWILSIIEENNIDV
jgi:hypothetical protein